MESSLYSQLKPGWHPEHLEALRQGQQPPPVHVQLILSDLCNQDCHFCAYRMSAGLSNELFVGSSPLAAVGTNNPRRQIPVDKALEIVEDCAALGVKAIQFTGGGEPTVHPHHIEIMARAQALGMETALVTNGLKLDPGSPTIRALKWIRVSVDAGDAESYGAVRRVPATHWEKVWSNIAALAPGYAGVLGIGFVVTPQNWRGIKAAARRARDAGVQNMRVGAVFSREGEAYYGDLIPAILEQIAGAKLELLATKAAGFEIIDLFGRRLGDLAGGAPEDAFCGYQYFTMYIGGDLNVYRCCNTAYTTAGLVGNLREQRLAEAVLAYAPFDARTCTYCQFLGQNKAIIALTRKPQHVNFV